MYLRLLAILILLLASSSAFASEDRQDIDVLYAGKPGSERMADFERFLAEHFAAVGTTSLETFTSEDADAYDVVILDWVSIFPRDKDGRINRENFQLRLPRFPELPKDYDKATVMISSVAARVGGHANQQLKFDWL